MFFFFLIMETKVFITAKRKQKENFQVEIIDEIIIKEHNHF